MPADLTRTQACQRAKESGSLWNVLFDVPVWILMHSQILGYSRDCSLAQVDGSQARCVV
jgi:hypothetical protein